MCYAPTTAGLVQGASNGSGAWLCILVSLSSTMLRAAACSSHGRQSARLCPCPRSGASLTDGCSPQVLPLPLLVASVSAQGIAHVSQMYTGKALTM